MAGAVGVAPWPYTWGELSLMAEGRDEAEWWHTASLESVILGCVGVSRTPGSLHPYERERNRPKTPEQLALAAYAARVELRAMGRGREKKRRRG